MKIHKLKIQPKYFEQIRSGIKTFEIRKNDRGFNTGDYLLLQEWDCGYSGEELIVRVTNILKDYQFPGITSGYCIMSFHPA